MPTEFRILKQDGYLDVGDENTRSLNSGGTEMRNIVYHPQLNVILVFDTNNQVKILDVNSGAILQMYHLGTNAENFINCRYMPLQDKLIFWDGHNLGFRGDYNGVLLLDTIMQTPIVQNDDYIKLEMLLSEAILFYNCIADLESEGLECPCDVNNELLQKITQAQANGKKGIKAQRWSTICLELPYSSLKLVANNVVIMLKRLERHIPVLAIASAINERLTDLLIGSRLPDLSWNYASFQRVLMHSEAARRQTFEKWPHMDYKWALPDQMAQAGFYHQPSASGEDRAMCFTCNVCLVCWEKTDEPWSEHERHSPTCPFVKGEYTQNVPISLTYATSPAVIVPGGSFDVVSNSDYANVLCTSCAETGEMTIWSIERHLKKMLTLNIFSLLNDAFDESFEWIRITAICVLPNERAKYKLNSMYAAQSGGSTCAGVTNSGNSNANGVTQFTSTSTLRAGVVGSKIVLGVSVRQSTGEYSLRLIVLNIVDMGADDFEVYKKVPKIESTNNEIIMEIASSNMEHEFNSKDEGITTVLDINTAENNMMYDFDLSNLSQLLHPSKEDSETTMVKCGGDIDQHIEQQVENIIEEAVKAQKISVESDGINNNYINNNNESENNSKGDNNNVDKTSISDEIFCVVECWAPVKRMNGLSCVDKTNVTKNNEIIEITEIIPTSLKCNQLLVKLQKTKLIDTGASNIIMATMEHELFAENELMNSVDENADDALAAQLLLFDYHEFEISNYYMQALTFSRSKCPKQLCILPYYNRSAEGRRSSLDQMTSPLEIEESGAVCIVCADGTVEIYTLSDFKLATTIEEEGEYFVNVAYCPSLNRICGCTRQGTLSFYSLSDSDNESGDEMLEMENEYYARLQSNAPNILPELCVTDGMINDVISLNSLDMSTSAISINNQVQPNLIEGTSMSSSSNGLQTSPSNSSIISNASLLAYKTKELTLEDLHIFYKLIQFDEKLTAYTAEVPNCWNDLGQVQKQRKQSQSLHNGDETQYIKTWRLHNDATTWDEHIIELNLAQAVSLGHIDLKFTVYQQCLNPAAIQVTLLKQNSSGFGYRMKGPHSNYKTSSVDDNIDLSYMINENPVLNEEYLQTHNAEILAGPMELSSCIDLCDQGGIATLTSPKLFKTRSRNFLLHIKTVSDLSKDGQEKTRVRKGLALPSRPHRLETLLSKIDTSVKINPATSNINSSYNLSYSNVISLPLRKKTRTNNYIGCDWLHEISISVRGVKTQTCIANGRAQRIAMLESNILLENLMKILVNRKSATMCKNITLDILIWIYYIRLNRYRSPKSERIKEQINKTTAANMNDLLAQQFECLAVSEKYIEDIIRFCIIHTERSTAHKAVKLLLILSEGICNLPIELQKQCTLGTTIKTAIANTFSEMPSAKSGGVVRWYFLLARVTCRLGIHNNISDCCIKLLKNICSEMCNRNDQYSALLGTRFGLYGFPFEPELFDYELPNINRGSLNTPASFTNVLRNSVIISPVTGLDIKRLSSIDGVDFRTFPHLIKGKSISNQLRGLLDVVQLHYNCVQATEATRLDSMDNVTLNSGPSSSIIIDDLLMMYPNSMELAKDKDDETQLTDIVNGVQNIVEQVKNKSVTKMPNEFSNGYKTNSLLKNEKHKNDLEEKIIKEEFTMFNNLLTMIDNVNNDSASASKPKRNLSYDEVNLQDSEQQKKYNEALETVCNASANVFAWHKLLTPPSKQLIVVDRMHSGARRHVVLDFGIPILLTDMVIPACDELSLLHIDVWCFEEEADAVRLVVAPDIGCKTLVLSDIQSPPICRYMKITIVGRFGMSSTKCKVPLGPFFGHPIILGQDGYGDTLMRCIKHDTHNIHMQIKALNSLYEDVHCRYSLASCKLMELLTPILNCELSNVAHMQAFITKQSEEETSGVDNNKIVAIYDECTMLQYQINVIRNVMLRLETSLSPPKQPKTVMPISKILQFASRDKLRVLSLNLVELLLHFSIEYGIKNILLVHQLFTLDVANMLFDTLVVPGDAHIQLTTCSLLVRMCCFQPWWGEFLANIFCNLFSSQNCKIFPQDRIFFLLTYLGRRSIAMGTCRSFVIDAILKTLVKNLAPISSRYQGHVSSSSNASNANQVGDNFGISFDMQLITWLLMFLSICLDDNNERKDKSATRWDFMSCESDFSKARPTGNQSGKQLRCLKKRIIQQSKYTLQPYADWGKKIYMIQNEHPGIFMEISKSKPSTSTVTIKPAQPSNKPNSAEPKIIKELGPDQDSNFDKGLKNLRLENILIVIRSLIALLLEMDFTCNMDQFLLTCKVIARLVAACRPAVQLSKVITTDQLEQLIRLAVWNDQQQPWAVHAIVCLLQDLLDADKQYKDNDITPTNDSSEQPHDETDDYGNLLQQNVNSMQVPNSDLFPETKYNSLPSLIECEDTEFDEILNDIDIIERTKPQTKKENSALSKNTFNFFCKSLSAAMDARLDVGLEFNVETQLRRFTNVTSLDLYSSLPQILTNEFISAPLESPTWPDYIVKIWTGPEYNNGMTTHKMFKKVFDDIFGDLHFEDTWVHLEHVLYMWLILNGELSDKPYSTGISENDVPKIPFGANAVQGLLLSLAWHNDIKLRTWCLGFQCLFLACNSQISGDSDADRTRIDEVIVNDENFEKMLLRFFSGYGMSSSIISNRCAGPTICKHLHDLLLGLHKKGESNVDVISCKRKLRDILLHLTLMLVQPGGAISNFQGPIDAQNQLVRDLLTMISDKPDINVALHIIESVSFLVYNNISNGDKLQCQSISDINANNAFNNVFASLLGSENAKPNSANTTDNSLTNNLLRLASSLLATELPRQPSEVPIPEDEELSNQSQTDEIKAEQLNTEVQRAKMPCLADTVLRRFPTMKRLLGSLSQCSSCSITVLCNSTIILDEPQTTADAVFYTLITLYDKASNPRLIVAPICKYLETSTIQRNMLPRLQLSEPFLWYITKVLENTNSVQIFTQLGGMQTICQNLVQLNKILLNVQPGLISLIMQHMTKNTKLKVNTPNNVNNNCKNKTTCVPTTVPTLPRTHHDGLINFAPFCTISSDNETVQSADILISNPIGAHRRPRSPAWSYIFYPNESHVDLTLTLPTAILLHEVQLQPHSPSLASCPSAVALEISRDFGLGPIPVGPPMATTGLNCIRLKLAKAEVATSIIVRLYRPKDSSNIGLSQIALLGQTIFSNKTQLLSSHGSSISSVAFADAEQLFDDDMLAKTSIGWVRILSRCFSAASMQPDRKLSADIIGASAAYPGFLDACCSLMNLMPLIPDTAQHHLQTVLLTLGAYNRDLCLQLLRILLWNTAPQVFKLSNEAICDMIYELTVNNDVFILDKIQVLLEWIAKLHDNYSKQSRCNNPQSGFVKVIASILWDVQTNLLLQNLQILITKELFDTGLHWLDNLQSEDPLKNSFDALLCSFCYIKPELFDELLLKLNINVQEIPYTSGLTDEIKEEGGSEWFANVGQANLTTLFQRPAYLSTIALAAQSPSVIYKLIDSGLPKLLAHALYEYCRYLLVDSKKVESASFEQETTAAATTAATTNANLLNTAHLTDADKATYINDAANVTNMLFVNWVHVPKILDFFTECCAEGALRNWMGTQQGSIFWKPLLELLCNVRPINFANTQLLQRTFIRLERATINFFTRVTACHPKNQDTMTTLLIDVIRNSSSHYGKQTISGFTRQLIIQLLLENERILVSVRCKQILQRKDMLSAALSSTNIAVSSNSSICLAYANSHPAKRINAHHLLFWVSTNTKCQEILQNCVAESRSNEANLQQQSGSAGGSVATKTGDSIMDSEKASLHALNIPNQLQVSHLEFLSVAAGVTAKDKRIKDVKNQTAANKDKEIYTDTPKVISGKDYLQQPNAAKLTKCAQLVHPVCYNMLISSDATVSQVLATLQNAGYTLSTPCLTLELIHVQNTELEDSRNEDSNIFKATCTEPLATSLQSFSSRGGLSLLAHYLPTIYPEVSMRKMSTNFHEKEKSPPLNDWVKLEPNDEIYEDLEDSIAEHNPKTAAISSVPQHSLAAFGLFLRLPSYSDVLLRDKLRAQCLLRLILGVTGDGEGNDIFSLSLAPTLPTLPFEVFRQLLDSSPLTTDDGMLLRRIVIDVGAMQLVLNCLAIFSHQSQYYQIANPQNDLTLGGIRPVVEDAPPVVTVPVSDDKSHMYWAKGTGFGTGSTAQSWNVEQALLRQKSEEEHVTVLLQLLSSYINPGDRIPASLRSDEALAYHEISEAARELPESFQLLLQQSCLLPALNSYLRNDSVLDITRHIPLYRAILQLLRALSLSQQLVSLLQPPQISGETSPSIAELLSNLKTCVDTYAKRLKVNKKSNIKGQTQQVTVNIDDGDDEGLALLIPDIQETSILVQNATNIDLKLNQKDSIVSIENAPANKSLEQRYLEIMKKLQFDSADMIVEAENNGFRFIISHHFEKMVRLAGDRYHPARVKRLAQEAVTLSTSLPLSYSSSVFVRCDTDRLDIMKVLITGPAETPYANGCFEFDVFFPADYPNQPMLINLETTGRHSVRFNPNLYNDGKVCLSVLNTWHGRPEEKWNAQTSSFLQVLVSIQSLILVPEPYFNEPGFERSRGSPSGTHSSREYNSNIYQSCVRWAMLEQIRNPSSCFKEVIHTHFWLKRNEICAQIEGWIEELSKPHAERHSRTISYNSMVLRRHYRHLREELGKLKAPNGLEDLEIPFNPIATLPTISEMPNNSNDKTVIPNNKGTQDVEMEMVIQDPAFDLHSDECVSPVAEIDMFKDIETMDTESILLAPMDLDNVDDPNESDNENEPWHHIS